MEEIVKQLRNVSKSLFVACIVSIIFALGPNTRLQNENSLQELDVLKESLYNNKGNFNNSDPFNKYAQYVKEHFFTPMFQITGGQIVDFLKQENFDVLDTIEFEAPMLFEWPIKQDSLEKIERFFSINNLYRYDSPSIRRSTSALGQGPIQKDLSQLKEKYNLGKLSGVYISYANNKPVQFESKDASFKNVTIHKYFDIESLDSLFIKYSFKNEDGTQSNYSVTREYYMSKSKKVLNLPQKWILDSDFDTLKSILFENDTVPNVLENSKLIWDKIENKTLDQAISSLKSEIKKSESELNIFGISIPEIIASYLGPLAISFILLYLYAHLVKANKMNVEGVKTSELLWLPLFKSKTACAISFISIIVLPCASSGFLSFRSLLSSKIQLNSWALYSGLILSLLCLIFGIRAWRKINSLKKKLFTD